MPKEVTVLSSVLTEGGISAAGLVEILRSVVPDAQLLTSALVRGERVDVPMPMSAPADQLDELLMIEQWFRTRPGEKALTAPTVVGALQALASACSAGLNADP